MAHHNLSHRFRGNKNGRTFERLFGLIFITPVGNRRIIAPAGQSWDDWFDSPGVSEDFMAERLQPEDQVREIL